MERRPVLLPARPAPLCPTVIFHRCRKARKCNYGEIALRQTSTSPGLPGPIPHLSPDCGRQPHICMCFAERRRGCRDPNHSARGSPQSGEAEAWGAFLDSGAKGEKGVDSGRRWSLGSALTSLFTGRVTEASDSPGIPVSSHRQGHFFRIQLSTPGHVQLEPLIPTLPCFSH